MLHAALWKSILYEETPCLNKVHPFVYKVKYELSPKNVSELFKCKNMQYSLRNSDFDIPRFETVCYGKQYISYLGSFIWSKLNTTL